MPSVRSVLTALLCVGLVAVAACSGSDDAASDPPATDEGREANEARRAAGVGSGDGYADADWFAERQDEYLLFATEELDPGSVTNVIAHAERAVRDPDYSWDTEAVTPEALAEVLDGITGWKDTSDFDVLNLVNVLYAYRDQIPA